MKIVWQVSAAMLCLLPALSGSPCTADYVYDAGVEECISLSPEMPEIAEDPIELIGDLEENPDGTDENGGFLEGEPLVPAERVNESDLNRILGEGIDSGIDHEVDAVREIRLVKPEDEGILQLAAEESGKTAETAADALSALDEGAELDRSVEESLENSGNAGDRQNGIPLDYEPAADRASAMAYLSSFMLSKVRDGSGEYDETTDLEGNDSDGTNGVVRTNDDLTYIYSYSTALGDSCMYNTIRGTRLYIEYLLPFGTEQAEFNLKAMPWLKGDAPDGGPCLTVSEDGSFQRLVGYRELPDRCTSDGRSYDVPGAGTVNCVIRVKSIASETEVSCSACAWLMKPDNRQASEDSLTQKADTSKISPVVRVSAGPYLRLTFEKSSKVTQVGSRIEEDTPLFDLSDGQTTNLGGTSRVFYFCVRSGKPNGSIKGVDPVDTNRRIHIEADTDFGVNRNVSTDLALYDLRTLSMRDSEGCIRGVYHSETVKSPSDGNNGEFGEIVKDSVRIRDGRIAFDIEGMKSRPGGLISHGTVTFIQKEDPADTAGRPIYWAEMKSVKLLGTPLLTPGGERDFQTGSTFRISNQVDPSGRWDSHLILCSDQGLSYPVSSSNMSTDGAVGYGMNFNCYLTTSYYPASEKEFEKSRDYFILWDNRKTGLRRGGDSAVLTALDEGALCRYVTKADGGLWADDAEMYSVDFASAEVYRSLRIWPDYDGAEAFLKGIHPDEEDVSRYICGVVCEAHGIPAQAVGRHYYQRICLAMKVLEIPENIGTCSAFIQAVRTYSRQITTSYSSDTGIGTDPAIPGKYRIRNWNLLPTQYEPTVWEDGALVPSSLTELNTLHKGTTLYIMPYTLSVREYYEGGLEAVTFDLSEDEKIRIRIEPSFAGHTKVQGADAVMSVSNIRDAAGIAIADNIRLIAVRPDGTEVPLECGNGCSVSDFVPGGSGIFEIEESNVSDPYDGGTFRIRCAADTGKHAVISGGSSEDGAVITIGSGSDPSGDWIFEKRGSGLYSIKNASSGRYLTDRSPKAVSASATQEKLAERTWIIKEQDDGTVSFISQGSGAYLAAPSGQGKDIVLQNGDEGASGRWKLTAVAAPEAEDGLVVHFKEMDSERGFPQFIFEGTLIKPLITGDTEASHRTVVTGDPFFGEPSKENGHLAAVSCAFTEIRSNTIRETVDREEVLPGEELTYTITYTNLYDSGHKVDITDLLPEDGDGSLGDVPPHEAGSDTEKELVSKMSGKAHFVEGSASVSADRGSPVSILHEDGKIRIRGTLESGETLTAVWKLDTSELSTGDVIRNSCLQDDAFGMLWSNRVETRILYDPRLELHMTLMTGGGGNIRLYASSWAALLAAAVCRRAGRKKRKSCR